MLKWDGLWGFLHALIRVMTLCLISLILQCLPECLHLPRPTFSILIVLVLGNKISSNAALLLPIVYNKNTFAVEKSIDASMPGLVNELLAFSFLLYIKWIQTQPLYSAFHWFHSNNLLNATRAFTDLSLWLKQNTTLLHNCCAGHNSSCLVFYINGNDVTRTQYFQQMLTT